MSNFPAAIGTGAHIWETVESRQSSERDPADLTKKYAKMKNSMAFQAISLEFTQPAVADSEDLVRPEDGCSNPYIPPKFLHEGG